MILIVMAMLVGCGAALIFHGEVGRQANYYTVSALIPMWLSALIVRSFMPAPPPLMVGGMGAAEPTLAHYAGGIGTLLVIPTGFIGIAIFRRYEAEIKEFLTDLVDSF